MAALLAVVVALCMLGVVVGLATAPLDRRRRLLRLSAFAVIYGTMELYVMSVAGLWWARRALSGRDGRHDVAAWERRHRDLLVRVLGWVIGAARGCFDFRLVVSDKSIDGLLDGQGAVLVLARHGGPGDSFVLVHLLLARYGRRVKIVLKEALQLDPAIDILLNRLGCCFLPPSAGDGEASAARVAALARDLTPGDALLIFPEGANWTPERRRRAIRHLRRLSHWRSARAAALMTNVLPPRSAGVLACVAARPDLAVVIVAHAGLDRIVHVGQAWRQIPLSASMTLRIWPAAPVPGNPDGRSDWLTTEWAVLDQWIEGYHTGALER
jgi:1-acyl-sn-glycerol-3-phosphate acyltransferase